MQKNFLNYILMLCVTVMLCSHINAADIADDGSDGRKRTILCPRNIEDVRKKSANCYKIVSLHVNMALEAYNTMDATKAQKFSACSILGGGVLGLAGFPMLALLPLGAAAHKTLGFTWANELDPKKAE